MMWAPEKGEGSPSFQIEVADLKVAGSLLQYEASRWFTTSPCEQPSSRMMPNMSLQIILVIKTKLFPQY
jgi:hypothetical protein